MARPWDLKLARAMARVLDDCYLDPALGFLLPGVGDALGSALGLGIVAIAVRRRLPLPVIARMLMNLTVDGLVGAVPLVGDAADAYLRMHSRNVALLEARHASRAARPSDYLVVGGAVVALLGTLAGAAALGIWAMRWLLAQLR